MEPFLTRKTLLGGLVIALLVALGAAFVYDLTPVSGDAQPVVFEIASGTGFRAVVANLRTAGLVRSTTATEAYMLLTGRALALKPGVYRLSASSWTPEITQAIAGAAANETTVTIPEGSNVFQIDAALSQALVTRPGAIVALANADHLEGRLFPDTYDFYTGASATSVVAEFLTNFDAKAAPLFATDTKDEATDLILASIVEKEVADPVDQRMVAGILEKRLAAGMPLDVDASVCYAKLLANPSSGATSCPSLTAADFAIDSPYNTYRYKGLPPAPIGNPGARAIEAVLNPQASPYWYYLSDPATGKTIYAKTLAEQEANQKKYLKP
ncbi:MAG TPA: endolytic transglycosylase MltG [Candidatus Paceibacterota bacterium]|nr:endolytic transglycosylase MltG [Candidatus Paceibacterota bacterium]